MDQDIPTDGTAARLMASAPGPVDMFLFDLDGTVTREELLPRIAAHFGVDEEIAALTRRTIAGDIPFESSLRQRVEILGRFPVEEVQRVVAGVEIDPTILDFLHAHRDRATIITGNLDAWLVQLRERIPVPMVTSRVTVTDGRVDGFVEILDKRVAAARFAGQRLCAVGEGHNDLGMFEAAEVSVAYGGVHMPADSLFDAATHVAFDPGTLCAFLSQL